MARAYLKLSTTLLEELFRMPAGVIVADPGTPGVVNLLLEHPSIDPDAGYVTATYRRQEALVFEGFRTAGPKR